MKKQIRKRVSGVLLLVLIILSVFQSVNPISSAVNIGKPISTKAVISAGDGHSLAITAGTNLCAWGSNEYGQLGDGTTTPQLSPVKIMDGVVSVSAGIEHTVAIKSDRSLWTWGDN